MNTNIYTSKKEGLVYEVTNNFNGKKYVGQTIGNMKTRIGKHYSEKRSGLLGKSMRKYGRENFTLKILHESKDVNVLNEMETHYINALNTKVPNGYNLVGGGGNTKGYVHREETKQLMSINRGRYYKEDNHFYRKKHSDETKKKISAIHKGKTISDEHIKNMVAKVKKRVINLDTMVIYDSVNEAGESVDKAPTNITRACYNPQRTVGGYRWAHYQEGMCMDNQQISLF